MVTINMLIKMFTVCVCVRASNDLKTHMVAVDTMEQFQKELDQGKVSNTTCNTRVLFTVCLHYSD